MIGAVDSTFIFGHVPTTKKDAIYRLQINRQDVLVHRDGGFLGFVPIEPGEFVFNLEAFRLDNVIDTRFPEHLSQSVTVLVPQPLQTIALSDSLVILNEYRPPSGDLSLRSGDRLGISFRGTAGCRAWFSIPGLIDSIGMAEGEPHSQPYWGEAVFGEGNVPDSLKIGGTYSAFWDIPATIQAESLHIEYFLAPPSAIDIFMEVGLPPYDSVEMVLAGYIDRTMQMPAHARSSYAVSINSTDFPRTVRFTDSVQIIRHEPTRGYFSIFQPAGVEAEAIGAEGSWYKLKLAPSQHAWASADAVELLPSGIQPPRSFLSSIRTFDKADGVIVRFPLSGKHAFQIIEDDRRTIRVRLFGVVSNTDWIRYDTDDGLIDYATWLQPEELVYELTVRLTCDIWGYDSYYEGNNFVLTLIKPPPDLNQLRGKKILIDPGHSSDVGAVGPTGLTEAEANLAIALAARESLLSRGAEVIMTRDDMSHVELYDRPAIAKASGADLFVSIHNNALPDGVNPFENNGSSTYYYHLHSLNLARAIQSELSVATGLGDYGLYHGNLAVARPTQYPAVLVECAFMMIPQQEALLKSSKFRNTIAHAIVRGIENYLKEYDCGR
jgi:N-acetylmuramoyl-L-alanine amidase